jgi:Primase X
VRDFRRYLIDQRLGELKEKRRRQQNFQAPNLSNEIKWIERLLLAAIPDYRKLAIWRILAPYLINIKTLPYNESYSIIHQWLHECNKLRRLDFSPAYRIKGALDGSRNFLPVSCEKLRVENEGFYCLLQKKGVLTK